ncbi:unnamed protein product [Coccothraustes coccothraustes]
MAAPSSPRPPPPAPSRFSQGTVASRPAQASGRALLSLLTGTAPPYPASRERYGRRVAPPAPEPRGGSGAAGSHPHCKGPTRPAPRSHCRKPRPGAAI